MGVRALGFPVAPIVALSPSVAISRRLADMFRADGNVRLCRSATLETESLGVTESALSETDGGLWLAVRVASLVGSGRCRYGREKSVSRLRLESVGNWSSRSASVLLIRLSVDPYAGGGFLYAVLGIAPKADGLPVPLVWNPEGMSPVDTVRWSGGPALSAVAAAGRASA